MDAHYQLIRRHLQNRPKIWLVTGVAGFIGSHLLEALLELDQRVIGLDNLISGSAANLDDVHAHVGSRAWQRFQFIEGDIGDPRCCERACQGVHYVLHQAALGSVPRSIKDPLATHAANVTGFLHILNAARDAQVERFVYASSSSVYGDHPGLPKVEEQTGRVLSPYAASKLTNEIYAQAYAASYSQSIVGLRYFNVFGPRQNPDGPYAAVIPKWISSLLRNERCVLFGDGTTSRDFTYVENVVQANLLAALYSPTMPGEVFNIACGERMSLNELYGHLHRVLTAHAPSTGTAKPDYREERVGDVKHSWASIEKATRQLGYVPGVDAVTGLSRTVDWHMHRHCATNFPAKLAS